MMLDSRWWYVYTSYPSATVCGAVRRPNGSDGVRAAAVPTDNSPRCAVTKTSLHLTCQEGHNNALSNTDWVAKSLQASGCATPGRIPAETGGRRTCL